MDAEFHACKKFQSLVGTVQRKQAWRAKVTYEIEFQSLIGTVQRMNEASKNSVAVKVSISHRYGSTLSPGHSGW